MNILLMGDSWGKGHLEYIFLKNKHIVFNKSWFGGKNSDTLHDALCFLQSTKDFIKIDLIIWFQTEYVRDFHLVKDLSIGYNNALENIHNQMLDRIIEIKNLNLNAKWVVIGGHAPIYKPASYFWADMVIEDWRSELLEKDLPFCHSISYEHVARENKNFGINVLEEELAKCELILTAVRNRSDLFHDDVHPGLDCYKQLYERIVKKFNII